MEVGSSRQGRGKGVHHVYYLQGTSLVSAAAAGADDELVVAALISCN